MINDIAYVVVNNQMRHLSRKYNRAPRTGIQIVYLYLFLK